MDAAPLQALKVQIPCILKGHGRYGQHMRGSTPDKGIQIIGALACGSGGIASDPASGTGMLLAQSGKKDFRITVFSLLKGGHMQRFGNLQVLPALSGAKAGGFS